MIKRKRNNNPLLVEFMKPETKYYWDNSINGSRSHMETLSEFSSRINNFIEREEAELIDVKITYYGYSEESDFMAAVLYKEKYSDDE